MTPRGWDAVLTNEDGQKIFQKWVRIHQAERQQPEKKDAEEVQQLTEEILPDEIEEEALLQTLRTLPPEGFERVCRRLLIESGFEQVEVTGKSHDGGIDVVGFLRLNPFIGIKTVIQCKRMKTSVSRSMIGDFRNAVMGRAEKGIFITTGSFTREAVKEASREGVIQIELVDGERLVEMFQNIPLGVIPKQTYEIDEAFFDQFRKSDAIPSDQKNVGRSKR